MGFQDIAKAISKAGALDFSGLGKALSLNTANTNQVARNVAYSAGKNIQAERMALRKAIPNMKEGSKELADATEQLNKLNSQLAGLQSTYRTGTIDTVNAALKEVTGKDKMGYMRFAGGYFGDKTYGGTRVKAAIGAYAGVNIGGRFLSGGGVTRNNTGERDIAGIPFI